MLDIVRWGVSHVARVLEGLANPNVPQRITSPTPTETVGRGELQTNKY